MELNKSLNWGVKIAIITFGVLLIADVIITLLTGSHTLFKDTLPLEFAVGLLVISAANNNYCKVMPEKSKKR